MGLGLGLGLGQGSRSRKLDHICQAHRSLSKYTPTLSDLLPDIRDRYHVHNSIDGIQALLQQFRKEHLG